MAVKNKLVFVYGTLKSGGRLNNVMHQVGGSLYGVGRILSKNFVMRDLGQYPALQKVEPGSGDYIIGEIWMVPVEGIAELDRVENYPRFYNRMSVDVWADEPTRSFSSIVYFVETIDGDDHGVRSYMTQSPVVESGDWDAIQNRPAEGDSSEGCEPMEEIDNGFVCDRGVYITSEYGEMYGPYRDIEEACQHVPDVAAEIGEDIRMLTVGFRIRRRDLDMEDLVDLDDQVTSL